MARLEFTSHLKSVAPPEKSFSGGTVAEVLQNAFDFAPQLKSYILDDQGRLRKHVCVFVDGTRLTGQEALSAPVEDSGEIYVMQALSGG